MSPTTDPDPHADGAPDDDAPTTYVDAGADPADPFEGPDGEDVGGATAGPGDPTPPRQAGPIVARPSNDYRVRRYIMCALLFGFGLYFLYDGYVGYPQMNREIAELERQQEAAGARGDSTEAVRVGEELKELGGAKSDLDILIQKILGFALPVLSAAYLLWTLRNSRGEYRLDADGTLHVPGHPPVPLSGVTGVDRSKWDRKGIARVDYAVGGQSGTLTLDDFVYQREPTDAIYDRVVDSPGARASSPTAT